MTVPVATAHPDSVTAVLGPDNAYMVEPLVELASSEHAILGKVANKDTVVVVK